MIRRFSYLLGFLFFVSATMEPLVGIAAFGADAVWSVEHLNSRKSEWDQLLGAPLKIEGRVSVNGRGNLRLAKCELWFIVDDASNRSLSGKASVELTGRFKKDRDTGRIIFDVSQIDVLPSDLDQYDSRAAKNRNAPPDDWYALGDWASERSRFYEDAELAKRAQSAYEHGINVAWRAMAPDDSKGRFELASKVTRFKLPDSRRMELMHEGYRVKWQSAIKAKQNDPAVWKELADEMANDLPGCKEPLSKLPGDLKDKYDKDALAIYRSASDDSRRQLHRLFYISVVLRPITNEAEQDGRNGDVIADRVEQLAPEAKVLAEQYRMQKLTWRMDRAASATRQEIEQLADELRLRRQTDMARQALQSWLQARESRLRDAGAVGLLQLAEEYLILLHDESRAVRILIEANRLDPSLAEVSQKLNTLGYGLVGGTWMKGAPAQPETATIPMAEPIPGGIAIGMTGAQLVKTMGGRPGSLTRVYTKKGVSEIWSYLPFGTSRIIVRLERSGAESDATVVEFRNEK